MGPLGHAARLVQMACVTLFLLSAALAGFFGLKVAESHRLINGLIRETIGDRGPRDLDDLTTTGPEYSC
jgi:hypothetical protein